MRILFTTVIGAVEFFWIPTFVTSWVYAEAADGAAHKVGIVFCVAWMNIIIGVKVTKLYGDLKKQRSE